METVFNEKTLRMASFFGMLVWMGAWEYGFKRKKRVDSTFKRWLNNLGMVAISNLLLQSGVIMLPVSFAAYTQSRGMGLFSQINPPVWAEWIAALVILDFIIYLQHILFHFVPVLWRLHQVHHSDLDIDVTTAIRFHPVEIIISLFIKLTAVAAFGFPPGAVLLFEIVLNATAMFNHANIYIPAGADRFIRGILITPDMHRVHHSVIMKESNTNFGFCLSLWDRLCGTYTAQPGAGHDGMTIGLGYVRKHKSLIQLLIMPFLKEGSVTNKSH
ncbi:MAG: sterol desaturase family protein [Desulfobacteraceae bacterium]|nr:MAG: sterol desaturase family protein [Desulfobacteraceae bacterium]